MSSRGLYRTSKKVKGSWEGYMQGNATRLHVNGTGYDATQKARVLRPSKKLSSAPPHSFRPNRAPVGSVHDYRLGKNGNSAQILSKRLRLGKII